MSIILCNFCRIRKVTTLHFSHHMASISLSPLYRIYLRRSLMSLTVNRHGQAGWAARFSAELVRSSKNSHYSGPDLTSIRMFRFSDNDSGLDVFSKLKVYQSSTLQTRLKIFSRHLYLFVFLDVSIISRSILFFRQYSNFVACKLQNRKFEVCFFKVEEFNFRSSWIVFGNCRHKMPFISIKPYLQTVERVWCSASHNSKNWINHFFKIKK